MELIKLKYNNIINSRAFKEPLQNMQNNYLRLDNLIKQMEKSITLKQKEMEKLYQSKVLKLDALSPLKTLARGFSIVEKDNKIVKSSQDLDVNDEINLRFIDGNKKAKII